MLQEVLKEKRHWKGSSLANNHPVALLISASDFDNDSRLQRLHTQISTSGFKVLTIAYGASNSEAGKYLSPVPTRSLPARLLDVAKMILSRVCSDQQLLRLLSKRLITRNLTQDCAVHAEENSFDLVIVKHWTSLPTALLLKDTPKVWLDINEVFEAEHDNSKLWQLIYKPVILRLLKIAKERIILRSATSLDQIKYMRDEEILHLPNTKEPIPELGKSRNNNKPIQLLYHGLITTNRSLPTLIKALHECGRNDMELTIRGHGKRNYIATLKKLVDDLDLSKQVHFEPSIANSELIKVASRYDIGFCLFANKSRQLMLAEPNKIYEYMAAGMGVIASDTPTMQRMVKDKNIGALSEISQNQTQAVAQILRELTKGQIINWQENSYKQAIISWDQNYDWHKLKMLLKQIQLGTTSKD